MHTMAPGSESAPPDGDDTEVAAPVATIRLYIARTTPNSVRAEQRLMALMKELGNTVSSVRVEIVDVFNHPKRAIIDGIIVTPTVVCIRGRERTSIMGDLTDITQLAALLRRWDYAPESVCA
jgi:circadian clock protein KaiB